MFANVVDKPSIDKSCAINSTESFDEINSACDAALNLISIRNNVEEYGINDQIKDLVDEDKQITNFIGTEFVEGNEAAVISAIDSKMEAGMEGPMKEQAKQGWRAYIITFIGTVFFWLLAASAASSGVMELASMFGFIALVFAIMNTVYWWYALISTILALNESDDSNSFSGEALGSSKKISVITADEMGKRVDLLSKAVKIISKDTQSEFKSAKVDTYLSIAKGLGYKETSGNKFVNTEAKTKSGTISELGWSPKASNAIIKKMKADVATIKSIHSKLSSIKSTIKSRLDALKAKAAKVDKSKITSEQKAEAKKKAQELKDNAAKISNISKLVAKDYNDLAKQMKTISAQFK